LDGEWGIKKKLTKGTGFYKGHREKSRLRLKIKNLAEARR
jgi:hypothetical protein